MKDINFFSQYVNLFSRHKLHQNILRYELLKSLYYLKFCSWKEGIDILLTISPNKYNGKPWTLYLKQI